MSATRPRHGRRRARPAESQGKTSTSDGPVRFTAPSLVFERDGGRLVAGGWQPLLAYDVLVANLAPELARTPPPDSPEPLLERFPGGLTTAEVAALLARGPDYVADHEAAEQLLVRLVSDAAAVRVPLGQDALWRAAGSVEPPTRAPGDAAVVSLSDGCPARRRRRSAGPRRASVRSLMSSAFSRRAASRETGLQLGLGAFGQRHLPVHQQVVDHEQRPLRQLRLGQLDIAPVLVLRGVHEQEAERPVEAPDGLERVPLDELDAIRDACPVQIRTRLCGAVGFALERDHPPAFERLGHVQGRVPDSSAHLEDVRVERPAQRG